MGKSRRLADREAQVMTFRKTTTPTVRAETPSQSASPNLRGESRVFWIVIFGLFLFTRIPAMSQYLSIDNANLAFSLDKFDPRPHQPQPPGYPLFVVFN